MRAAVCTCGHSREDHDSGSQEDRDSLAPCEECSCARWEHDGARARAEAEQSENDAADALIRRAATGGFES